MDMSGKFDFDYDCDDDAHADALEMARSMAWLADRTPGGVTHAVAWRDGKAITVDLTRPLPPRAERVWPEHVAIAALFLATYAMALNQLKF